MKLIYLWFGLFCLCSPASSSTVLRIRAEGIVTQVQIGNQVAVGDRLNFRGVVVFRDKIPLDFTGTSFVPRGDFDLKFTSWLIFRPGLNLSTGVGGPSFESFRFQNGALTGFEVNHFDEADPTWIFSASRDANGLFFHTNGLSCCADIPETSSFRGELQLITSARSVPEPSIWLVMIIGLGAVGFTQRVQRRQSPTALRYRRMNSQG
jgi:hypothetical protein